MPGWLWVITSLMLSAEDRDPDNLEHYLRQRHGDIEITGSTLGLRGSW